MLRYLYPAEVRDAVLTSVRWTLLGGAIGGLTGSATALFLALLADATRTRMENPALILLLPLGGFAVGWLYWRWGGAASQGNNLVIEEVHTPRQRVPFRMAPFVLIGTVLTHLFGGSAGREGTAVQMGASLADTLRRLLRIGPSDRRLMLMAGISAGVGSVFGTPVAGFVFGMEVQSVGRIRYEGAIPCLAASFTGDLVTRAWGIQRAHYPRLPALDIDGGLALKIALAGIVFGLTSALFIEAIRVVRNVTQSRIAWPPLRPVAGGLAVIALTLLAGTTDYNGIGLPLIERSLSGEGVIAFAFLLKLVFTAVTLGTGFLGGEVTPLFVIGATCGFTAGTLLGLDPTLAASVGFVAVFAGAANTPLACTLMGVELFGGGGVIYLLIGCVTAYLASGQRGIYATQRIDTPKRVGLPPII